MKKDKLIFVMFLFGLICERYMFPLLDMGIGLLSNKYSVSTSRSQSEINDITLASEYTQTNAIGFTRDVEVYDEDDIESKKRNKIGFAK